MACYTCCTKFNFFHKEMGCANCGYAFCGKCLKQKCKITKSIGEKPHQSVEKPVCKQCYLILTSPTPTQSATDIPPPDIFLRRLEALANPPVPPITVYRPPSNGQNHALRSGLCAADQQIFDRLQRLRRTSQKQPPTEHELRQRLDVLKAASSTTSTDFPQQIVRNSEAPLNLQQQQKHEVLLQPDDDNNDEDDDEIDKITTKLMDEVALEEKLPLKYRNVHVDSSSGAPSMDLEDTVEEEPELPWCVLCNEDAMFQCKQCDNDLYCAKCNAEYHRVLGESDHEIVPIKPQI